MRFIDTNVIAYAFYENKRALKCQAVIKQGGVINNIVLIEAFNVIEKYTHRDHAIKSIRGLLKCNLTIVNTDINAIFDSLRRASKVKLKFIDLLHYTTAIDRGCSSIVSYDKDFDGLDIKRVEP